MLHSLVQVLPIHPYVKQHLASHFLKVGLRTVHGELFWPYKLFQKNIFPFAQLTYLSEHFNNLLKGALAVLFLRSHQDAQLCLDYHRIFVSSN